MPSQLCILIERISKDGETTQSLVSKQVDESQERIFIKSNLPEPKIFHRDLGKNDLGTSILNVEVP